MRTPAATTPPKPATDGGRQLVREMRALAQPSIERANQIVLEMCERGEIDPTRQFRVRVKIRTRNMPQ